MKFGKIREQSLLDICSRFYNEARILVCPDSKVDDSSEADTKAETKYTTYTRDHIHLNNISKGLFAKINKFFYCRFRIVWGLRDSLEGYNIHCNIYVGLYRSILGVFSISISIFFPVKVEGAYNFAYNFDRKKRNRNRNIPRLCWNYCENLISSWTVP